MKVEPLDFVGHSPSSETSGCASNEPFQVTFSPTPIVTSLGTYWQQPEKSIVASAAAAVAGQIPSTTTAATHARI